MIKIESFKFEELLADAQSGNLQARFALIVACEIAINNITPEAEKKYGTFSLDRLFALKLP